MYTYAVGLADALWLCPERALRLFFASVSFVDPVRTVAPLAAGVIPLRTVVLEEGRLPMRWVLSEPMGLAVAPPISPYTSPGQSPSFGRTPIGAQVSVSYFLRDVPHVFMAINLSVSLAYACPSLNIPIGLCYLDT